MYNGEQLAQALTVFGLPCVFKEMKQTPRNTIYYFDFTDWNKVTAGRRKTALDRLSLYAEHQFNYIDSNISHFAIYHAEVLSHFSGLPCLLMIHINSLRA